MLGKGGQLGTHGEGRGGQIVMMGASRAVRTNKNAAFLGRKIDVAPAWPRRIGKFRVSNNSPIRILLGDVLESLWFGPRRSNWCMGWLGRNSWINFRPVACGLWNIFVWSPRGGTCLQGIIGLWLGSFFGVSWSSYLQSYFKFYSNPKKKFLEIEGLSSHRRIISAMPPCQHLDCIHPKSTRS